MKRSRSIVTAVGAAGLLGLGCWLVLRGPAAREGDGYTGSSGCRDCHARFYDLWAGSRHNLAMQAYSDTFSQANLAPQTAKIAADADGASYLAEIGPSQGWIRETAYGRETKFPISHVLGGKNVYYFLTPLGRGRLQKLPLGFDVRKKVWYDVQSDPDGHERDRATAGTVPWTSRSNTFNTSCFGCHVSQMSTRYDPSTDTYETRWKELGINCEACHGPGDAHAAACRSAGEGAPPKDLKILRLKSQPADLVNSLCGSCHAKMSPVSAGFSPGEGFFDHYDLAALESPDFYPDGRDLGENYTMTSWRMSACVQAGSLDCLHCHTSSGRYRFAAPGAADEACLPCHRDQAADAGRHSRHGKTAAPPRCIDCHMPATTFAGMRRTDHSMRPPVPEATVRYGSPNACNICHADQGADWAQRRVKQWGKATRQPAYLRSAAFIEQARRKDWRNLPQMLACLQTESRNEIFAVSLVRLLRGCPSASKWPVLAGLLEHDPSPLVRAAAAEHLGGSLTAETIPALAKAVRDDSRLVRVRAAAGLAPIDARRLEVTADGRHLVTGLQQAVERATGELLAGMTARGDQPASHFNLANILAAQGRTAEALSAYQTAIKLQPDFVPAYVNMAFIYHAEGASGEAETCLMEALKREPRNALILTNLGLLVGEGGRWTEAESFFRQAWAIDQTSAVVAYNLAVIQADARPKEAASFAEKAFALSPDNARYAYAYAFQLDKAGQTRAAEDVLKKQVERGPSTAETFMLLGQILEREKRTEEAAAVYLKAANDPLFPEAQRRSFSESADRVRKR